MGNTNYGKKQTTEKNLQLNNEIDVEEMKNGLSYTIHSYFDYYKISDYHRQKILSAVKDAVMYEFSEAMEHYNEQTIAIKLDDLFNRVINRTLCLDDDWWK